MLTLEQMLELVLSYDGRKLFVETKKGMVGSGPRPALEKYNWKIERALVEFFKDHGIDNPRSPERCRAAVISFFPEGLRLIRREAPGLATMYHAVPHQATSALRVATWAGANGVGLYPRRCAPTPNFPTSRQPRG